MSAENYLMTGPENMLEGKPFLAKLFLISKYLPLFSLTAFFRIGSGVINVLNYISGSFAPFRPIYSLILTWYALNFFC